MWKMSITVYLEIIPHNMDRKDLIASGVFFSTAPNVTQVIPISCPGYVTKDLNNIQT